jgi:hypothetical protein
MISYDFLLNNFRHFNWKYIFSKRYVQAGVECDVEFRSGLESLRDARRYQGILLVRELALAHAPRLFLNSATFFENIMLPICDRNPQIRFEAIELFRLSLIICINREALSQPANYQSTMTNRSGNQSGTIQRIRRTSTSSSFGSISQDSILLNTNMNSSSNQQQQPNVTTTSSTEDKTMAEIKSCFKNSVKG